MSKQTMQQLTEHFKITAEAVSVDGFTLSQTDNAGVMTTFGRSYTAPTG